MHSHDPLFPTGRRGKLVTECMGMRAASGHHAVPGPALLVPALPVLWVPALLVPFAVAPKILAGWRSRRVLRRVPGLHVVGPSHNSSLSKTGRLYRTQVATQANVGPKCGNGFLITVVQQCSDLG